MTKSHLSANTPDLFLAALEEQQRTPRLKVLEQLKSYQPFLAPFVDLGQTGRAIDLGSGRGEWLEILRDQGFEALGVDSNQSHIAAGLMYGLQIYPSDPLRYLEELESQSVSLVSSFSLVDELSLEQLRALVAQALRVIRPGGILILGAANPEYAALNISAQTLLHTDTLQKNPKLIDYVTAFEGFERHIIARTFQVEGPRQQFSQDIRDILLSANPRYAVIAQKQGPDDFVGAFDEAFDGQYGLSLSELAMRYLREQDDRITGEVERINAALASLDSRVNLGLASVNAQLNSFSRFIRMMAFAQEKVRLIRNFFLDPSSPLQKRATKFRFDSKELLKRVGLFSFARTIYRLWVPHRQSMVDTSDLNQNEPLSERAQLFSKKIHRALKHPGKED